MRRQLRERIRRTGRRALGDRRGQGGSVTTLVTVGATLFISILVMAQIVAAVPATSNGPFASSYTQVVDILNSTFLLAGILPLVVAAGALLYFVRRMDSGGGRLP